MSLSKLLMRLGNVGGYARWAANYYHDFMRRWPDSNIDALLKAMIETRYNSRGAEAAQVARELTEAVENNGIDGVQELVIGFLVSERKLGTRSIRRINNARQVIGDELEKHGVPWNFTSDPEKFAGKLALHAKLAAEEFSKKILAQIGRSGH